MDPTPTPLPTTSLQPERQVGQMLHARRLEGQDVHYTLGMDWHNGRSIYGGAVAMVALDALTTIHADGRPVRSLQVNFVGALQPGPTLVRTRRLREGRSVTQASASVIAADASMCEIMAVFAHGRPSRVLEHGPQRVATREPESARALRFTPGVTPPFLQHIDTRWVEGAPPFRGSDLRHSRIWVRLRDEPIASALMSLLFADVMPTPAMGQLREPTYSASLSWSVDFFAVDEACDRSEWWRVDTELTSAYEGLPTHASTLFAPDGRLAALSHQRVTLYG